MTDINSLLDSLDASNEENPNSRVLLIDGLNMYLRVFAVNGALNERGVPVGGIIGFLKSLGATIREINPTRCIVVYDGAGGSARRRKINPEYKNNRKPHRITRWDNFKSLEDEKEAMKIQFLRLLSYLELLPVQVMSIDHIEADDTIAYLAREVFEEEVYIVSADQDFLQLVDDRVTVWNANKKKYYTPSSVRDEYGIPAHNFLAFKALYGDKSDNLPGVKGLGPKKIPKVIPQILGEEIEFDDIMTHAQENDGPMHKRIVETQEQLEINWKLMSLKDPLISGIIKHRIEELTFAPVNLLSKNDFNMLYLEDKMGNAFKSTDIWMNETFMKLNKFAKLTHDEQA
jgi:DNA polymerase-1